MATKKTTKRTRASASSKGGFLRACSFIALVIAAGIFVLGGILNALKLGGVVGILNLIGQICLLIGIGVPAYDYTCGKKTVWRIVYWIALLVYLLGCVLGVL